MKYAIVIVGRSGLWFRLIHPPHRPFSKYRISSYSFRGSYSFLNLEIQRSQYIKSKVTLHKGVETIQGRKLYEEIRYVGNLITTIS